MAKGKQAPTTGANPLVAVIMEKSSPAIKDSLPVTPKTIKDAPISAAVIRTHKAAPTPVKNADSGSLSKSAQDWVLGKISTKQYKENVKAAKKSR